jgi:type IV pilus assembly protein PilO
MLANLSSRMIAFIVIGLSLLVALIWYLTLYQSAQTTIADLSTQIDALEAKKQVGENAQRNVIRLCGVVAGLETDKVNFLSSLPSSEQFSKLLTSIRTQIANNKGQLNSINRQLGAGSNSVIPAGIRAVNLTLTLEGTYSSLFGILVALEQQQRFLNVDNVSFQTTQSNSADSASNANPKLSSNLSIAAYVYDDPNRNTQTNVNPICVGLPTSETPTPTAPITPTTPTPTGEVPK